MIINIVTSIKLNFESKEYIELISEFNKYILNEETDLINTLKELLDDLQENYHKLSNFTVGTHMNIRFAGEFFKDLREDIEDIDNEEYPLLCNLLIKITNSI